MTDPRYKLEDIEVNLENILYYVTHHSESIIQWLFLTILLLSSVLIARGLFARKEEVKTTDASVVTQVPGEIQEFLKKILDQTAKLESVSLGQISLADVAQVDVQVQALKKELQGREEELSKMKAAGDTRAPVDAEKLSGRIKELESKLAEYEILEDDIADLSLYKEENARLRQDLEKFKNSDAPAAPISPTSGEDIVAEFAEAVTHETVPSRDDVKELSNPMAEIESAVNLEKKMRDDEVAAITATLTPPAPIAAPTPPLAPALSVAAPAATAPTGEGDDLFAEFATATPDHDVELNTDKMMEEMAALVGVEGSLKASLEEGIDTDKMVFEATQFTTKS